MNSKPGKSACGYCKNPITRGIHVSVSVFEGDTKKDEVHFCDQVCLAHGMIDFLDMMLKESLSKPERPR